MKTRLAAIGISVVLVASACSSSGDSNDTASAATDETTTTVAPDETVASEETTTTGSTPDLESRLLTVDDLPAGWEETEPLGDDDVEDDDGSDDEFCPAAEAAMSAYDEADDAEVAFEQSDLGPLLAQMIAPSTEEQFDAAMEALDTCIGEEWSDADDDGSITDYSMERGAGPTLGEKSQSYRLDGTFDEGSMQVEMIFGYADGAISAIMAMSFQTPLMETPQLSEAELVEIVEAASDKLLS